MTDITPTIAALAPITPSAMLATALAQGAPIELLEKLMALQERHEANQARKAFESAMALAAGEMPQILKSKVVDFTTPKGRTHYKYEALDDVLDAVRPVLARHGLTARFRTDLGEGGRLVVTCRIVHAAGHFEENTLSAPRDESGQKNYIQSVGSTLSYLARYSLKAALGLAASVDDDGQASQAGREGTISPEQASQIDALLGELHDPKAREKVLAFAQAPSVPEIPAALHERVLAWLRAKKVAEIDAEAADLRKTQAAAEAAANPTDEEAA